MAWLGNRPWIEDEEHPLHDQGEDEDEDDDDEDDDFDEDFDDDDDLEDDDELEDDDDEDDDLDKEDKLNDWLRRLATTADTKSIARRRHLWYC